MVAGTFPNWANTRSSRPHASWRVASTLEKDEALCEAAELLEARCPEILEANYADVQQAAAGGRRETEIDRLRLTEERIGSMAEGLRTVAGLADPVGQVVDGGGAAERVAGRRVCGSRSASSESSTRTART